MRTITFALLLLAGVPVAAAGRYGEVQFANSGAAAAQHDFLEGLALLHDFEYGAAADAFRRAEAADPGFALAYWGEAMSYNHPVWMQQDLAAARAALAKLAPTPAARRARAGSERERAYMDAIEILYGPASKYERDALYEAAMARLHQRYPDDVDAAAFYGLSILGGAHQGRDIARYMRAAGVLEEAWMDHREHPGLVHYLIHSYDDPVHAPLGLRAARSYARIAPDAGHAQHMTSHIFLALGMWPETVGANVAALAAANRARQAQGQPAMHCGHYASWLEYAYLQLGQTAQAKDALAACRAMLEAPRPAEPPARNADPDASPGASYANMYLRYLLESGDWQGEVAGWPLPVTAHPGARLDFAFAYAMGQIAQGHGDAARAALAPVESLGREVAALEASQGDVDPNYRVRPRILLLEAQGLLAEQAQDWSAAEARLREAVALEDALPMAFGPPTIDKPTRELLGEFLLRRDRRDEARAEFTRALERAPGRRLAQQGLAATHGGAASR